MHKSYIDFMKGNTTTFVDLLEECLGQGHIRSLVSINESNAELVSRCLWIQTKQCVDQLHLIMDPTKAYRDGRNGFADVFVGNSQREVSALNSVVVIEFKSVSLLSLWKGKQQNPRANPTSQYNYEALVNELRQADEDQMLDMKHSVWDKNAGHWVTLKVNDIMQNAITQVNNYLNVISCGLGGQSSAGVQDDRVRCSHGGQDVLHGYVIMFVGGARAICRPTMRKHTQWSYEVKVS